MAFMKGSPICRAPTRIDNGRRPGRSTRESAELRAARARIRQLKQELEIVKRASRWLSEEERVDPKGRTR